MVKYIIHFLTWILLSVTYIYYNFVSEDKAKLI